MNGKLTAKKEIIFIDSGHRKSPPPSETCPLIYIFFSIWLMAMEICVLSPVWLCDLINCSPPGFSVHGILQARLLEWVAISSSRESSQPRNWTLISCISCIGRWILYHQHHLESPQISHEMKWSEVKWSEVSQSCPTLCDPMDCVAYQASPSIGFSRQEYWSGFPFPSPKISHRCT